MGLYTRQQLALLLLLVAAGAVGLGVVHWRAAHPQLVERLERIDREIADAAVETPPAPSLAETPGSRPRGEPDAPRPARSRAPKRSAPASGEPGAPLDLNRATVADLMRLPGIGAVMARRIVETRDEIGRFGAVDDLVGVRGLGRTRLERLRPLVGVLE